MTKTNFLKILKSIEGERAYSKYSTEKVKIKILFKDGYWNFDCKKYNLIEVRKYIRKNLLTEDFKKIIKIEFN